MAAYGGAIRGALAPEGATASGYGGALGRGIAQPSNSSIADGAFGGLVSYEASQAGMSNALASAAGGFAGRAVSGFFGTPLSASWGEAWDAAGVSGFTGLLGGLAGVQFKVG